MVLGMVYCLSVFNYARKILDISNVFFSSQIKVENNYLECPECPLSEAARVCVIIVFRASGAYVFVKKRRNEKG